MLIQEEHLSVMVKICALSTGNLLRGGLPRNSVDRITDRPDMTSDVYRGRKASTQTKLKSRVMIKSAFYKCNKKQKKNKQSVNQACGN